MGVRGGHGHEGVKEGGGGVVINIGEVEGGAFGVNGDEIEVKGKGLRGGTDVGSNGGNGEDVNYGREKSEGGDEETEVHVFESVCVACMHDEGRASFNSIRVHSFHIK